MSDNPLLLVEHHMSILNRGHLWNQGACAPLCSLRYHLLVVLCSGLLFIPELIWHCIRLWWNSHESVVSKSIVICGSSIVARWHAVGWAMSPLPIANCAVSGSKTSNLPRPSLFHNAPVVVVYIGSNDLKGGDSPTNVASHLSSFVQGSGNKTRVVLISSIKSPDRYAWWHDVDAYNRLQQEIVSSHPKTRTFVDVNVAFKNHPEYFCCDGLHLTFQGLGVMGDALRPVLEHQWVLANGQEDKVQMVVEA
jgi:hypothetical protein